MFIYFYSIIEVLVVLVPILLGVAFITVIERKVIAAIQRRVGPNMVGFYGVLQPFADALKLVVKETIVPNHANRVLLFLAPIVTLTFSLLGWAVIPLGQGFALVDLSLGILFSIALSSVGILGILFAGWSSNSKYAFIGGIRTSAQMLSYELILTSVILIVILITGTFSYTNIIQLQQSVWFVVPLLPLFIIWFFSALAETNRTPFDLPEAFWLWCNYITYFNAGKFETWPAANAQRLFIKFWQVFFIIILVLLLFMAFVPIDISVDSHLSISHIAPVAVFTASELKNERVKLWKKSGIYGIKNNATNQIYIGSAKNLYLRFSEHLSGEKTNVRLWNSIQKYGVETFSFIVLEYIPYNVPHILEVETTHISNTPVELLFNFKTSATSIQGYVHTQEAKEKMRKRFLDKTNHPMYGKHHTLESRLLISQTGALNPIFGKTHSVETRNKISQNMSIGEVKCYDVNINLMFTFANNVMAAQHFNVSKSTLGRYIASEKLFLNQYYLRKNDRRKLFGIRASLGI